MNRSCIQLDLSQFRIYLFALDVRSCSAFLSTLCERLTSSPLLYKTSDRANQSYASRPPRLAPMNEFIQPQRYTTPSSILNPGDSDTDSQDRLRDFRSTSFTTRKSMDRLPRRHWHSTVHGEVVWVWVTGERSSRNHDCTAWWVRW